MSIKLPLHDHFSHQFSCQNYFTQRIYAACHRRQKKSHIPRPHDTIPIPIKITPPRTSAFPDSFVPRVLPRHNPVSHITNVTTATISEQTTAITKPYPAVVNPTDNASIDVAIPAS